MPLIGRWFYVAIAVVILVAVVVGFAGTYVVPMARGAFEGPTVLHLHGALALSWVLLFLSQPLLVRLRRQALHRRLGWLGLPLATGVALTMVPAGLYQASRDSAAGAGPTGISSFLGVVTSAILFVTLVACGILARRDREAHARWLLLATLVVAWPAWFRWRHLFPSVPRPDIWFAVVLPYAWVGVAMLRDRVVRAAVHPVLAFAGSAVVLEQSLEVIAFDTPPWRAVAQLLYGWLQT